MKQKLLNYLKHNYCLIILLTIYLVISIFALKELSFSYTIMSDDYGYIKSGIRFFEEGIITMHGVETAQIMPGMTFLISFFCLIFGTGIKMISALKILLIIFGGATLTYLYKTIKMYSNQFVASICSLLLLTPDYIWTNNLILTETPYIMLQMMLIYYTLKLSESKKTSSYVMIIICYVLCLFIRPTIALFPIFLFVFLVLKKYEFKRLIKQGIIAAMILICVLTPWIIRNYKIFGDFIPLTYGVGNPLLLGTYQGIGFPDDKELDYENNVYLKMDQEKRFYIENREENKELASYYGFEYDELKAKYRIQEWWKKDKSSLIKSYLFYKPKMLLSSTFYWDTLFNIEKDLLIIIHKVEFIIFCLSMLLLLVTKKYIKELIMLLGFYIYNLALYSYTFAYGRYALTMYPIRFIIIGLGIGAIIKYIKDRRSRNEKN